MADWRVTPNTSRLKSFTYRWAFDVGSSSVLNLIRGRAQLESLTLEHVGERSPLGDEVLEELAQSCPNLKCLCLIGHLRFTDRGILSLLSGCKMLSTLSLSNDSFFPNWKSAISLEAPGLGALTQARVERNLQVTIDKRLGVDFDGRSYVKAVLLEGTNHRRPAPGPSISLNVGLALNDALIVD